MKEPTKAQLKNDIAKYEKLAELVRTSAVFVPKDDVTKVYHIEGMNVTIIVTALSAVVRSVSSTRIFPFIETSENSPYMYLYQYVDIMTGEPTDDEELLGIQKSICTSVEQFLYVLFDADSNFNSPASSVLNWSFYLSKNVSILDHKVFDITYGDLAKDVTLKMLEDSVFAKVDTSISKEKADEVFEGMGKLYDEFIEKARLLMDENGCEFSPIVLLKPNDVDEAEALAMMEQEEKIKADGIDEV